MKSTMLGVVVVAALAVSGAGVASAAPSSWQSMLDGLVAEGAVGVTAEVRDGAGLWRGSAGVTEAGGPRPPVDGRFRAGSVTKSFTATVVLQLVDEGRVALTDSVQRLVPGLLPPGRITVQDLVGHTSGLPEYGLALLDTDGVPLQRWRTWTPEELVRTALRVADPEPPGKFGYTNTDYVLLGLVIEKVTGRSHRHEVERRILRPLGLADTRVPGAFPFVTGPHARGHVVAGGRTVEYTAVNPTLFGAAGEIVSTTADLNRFYTGLLDGRLLRDPELAKMKANGLGMEHAYFDRCRQSMYGHGGGVPGYNVVSFQSEDTTRRITVSWTGRTTASMSPLLTSMLAKAAC
ncbi:serine hydrolase domain-containing protein [Actinosynnema sp. NPDC047251]|uniref:Beta-lactamase, class C n=1 Tax=Saccharothrix espanaensis (strain ATCC 51144 / DSM 44229 / JCM 9112 / NBRC 15066 / NRRL 15764) TaxID=1179773 RepID=K0K4C0_SACES|nr:serine hydrolase domain-containing protein [Saccharothrix espanaensis]CCH31704.1 beta-lactamase, class C [Saccharothrix espanaensis DSM 44229]